MAINQEQYHMQNVLRRRRNTITNKGTMLEYLRSAERKCTYVDTTQVRAMVYGAAEVSGRNRAYENSSSCKHVWLRLHAV